MSDRVARAYAAIDAVNADDPHTLEVRGQIRPKEQAHAEMACEWIQRLVPKPSDALLVAARAHHIRRWVIPRADYAAGRKGYLMWRKALQKVHAQSVGEILESQGWDEPEIQRVQELVQKKKLGRDEEVQAFEDALCLVFLETQLAGVAAQLENEHTVEVLCKTMKKMSTTAVSLAEELPLDAHGRALLKAASEALDGENA